MSSIDLRLLRYFIAVAEEAHLTKAAQRLGIQQPPLSQQIRVLENELGVTLFTRLPRGMALTEAGHMLLDEARGIFARLDSAVAGVRGVARGELGHLAVGFTESASLHPFVPRVLRAFREAAPDVGFAVEENNTPDLVQAIHDKRLDAAFIRSPISNVEGLVIETLLVEEMIVALPAAHRLARARSKGVALAALAQDPFILIHRPNGPGFYDTIISACQAAGFCPNVIQETHKNLSTLSLVAAGLGVSIIPASMHHVEIEGVVYRRICGAPALRAPLHLAWRSVHTSGALARLIALARALAEDYQKPARF
jgi:DNA-binding transcriptional LysR family regulator